MTSQALLQFVLVLLVLLPIVAIQVAALHLVWRVLLDPKVADSALTSAIIAGVAVFTAANTAIPSSRMAWSLRWRC